MTKNISLDNVMLKVQMRNRSEASITWEDRNSHTLVVLNVNFLNFSVRTEKAVSAATVAAKEE